MPISYPKGAQSALVLVSLLMVLGGCASMGSRHRVKTGEEVRLHYTCRLQNGEIVATTDKDVAEDPSQPKSSLFDPKTEYGAPVFVAGSGIGGPAPLMKLQPFESEIGAQLTRAIVGLELDKEEKVEIASAMQMGLDEGDRFLSVARIRPDKPKEHRMTWEEYRKAYGKEPVVGQEAFSLGPVTGKVASVEGSDVVLRLSVEEGGSLDMALGKAVYHNKEDHFDIVIDAHVGDLVRTGWLVGRIVEVGDQTITIDYGHPLGGETLTCDVLAESPEDQAEKNIEK